MSKYYYRYIIYTDNLCHGYRPVSREYHTLSDAKTDLYYYMKNYGICVIKKKRYTANT